jgi:hypothetical protein
MMAHTRDGLAGDTAMPTLPQRPLGRPGLAVSSVQVRPPSVVFMSPPPGPPELSSHGVRYACQKAA